MSHWSASGRPTRGPTSRAPPTTACCSWPSATTASSGSQATRAAAQVRRPRWAGGPGGGMNLFFGGKPGITRLFGPSMGVEASWLLPAALIGLVAGLWLTWRTARTDRVRAGLLLWGGWLLVTGAVFSFMAGTVHPYYNVALAPAVAALVGIAVAQLVKRQGLVGPAAGARRHARGHRGVVVPVAEPDPRVVARRALGGTRRIDRGRAAARGASSSARPRDGRRSDRGCARRAGRPCGVLDLQRRECAQWSWHHVRTAEAGRFRRTSARAGGPVDPAVVATTRKSRRCSGASTTVGRQQVSARCR